jgi:hypothetical protein
MSKRQLRNVALWKLALRFGSIFMLIVVLIQALLQFFRNGNFNKVSQSLEDGTWAQYVITTLLIGAVYGVTTALITKNNLKKK